MTVELSRTEVAMLVAMVADLNPDEYVHDSAKSLIYKCKDIKKNNKSMRIR